MLSFNNSEEIVIAMWVAKYKRAFARAVTSKKCGLYAFNEQKQSFIATSSQHNKQATRWWLKPHATGLEQILEKHIILHHIFCSENG